MSDMYKTLTLTFCLITVWNQHFRAGQEEKSSKWNIVLLHVNINLGQHLFIVDISFWYSSVNYAN